MRLSEISTVGVSFHDVTIIATVNSITRAIGEPQFAPNDGDDKVNFEWNCEIEVDGEVKPIAIYDWKEYRIIDEDELIDFHIAGFDRASTLQAKEELLQLIKEINGSTNK